MRSASPLGRPASSRAPPAPSISSLSHSPPTSKERLAAWGASPSGCASRSRAQPRRPRWRSLAAGHHGRRPSRSADRAGAGLGRKSCPTPNGPLRRRRRQVDAPAARGASRNTRRRETVRPSSRRSRALPRGRLQAPHEHPHRSSPEETMAPGCPAAVRRLHCRLIQRDQRTDDVVPRCRPGSWLQRLSPPPAGITISGNSTLRLHKPRAAQALPCPRNPSTPLSRLICLCRSGQHQQSA